MKQILLLSVTALALVIAAPITVKASEEYDCDKHAAHLDHEIGAEKALEAYHVLHGDHADDHHAVEALKHDHSDIEHELEEYVAHGCSDKELEAHSGDHH